MSEKEKSSKNNVDDDKTYVTNYEAEYFASERDTGNGRESCLSREREVVRWGQKVQVQPRNMSQTQCSESCKVCPF